MKPWTRLLNGVYRNGDVYITRYCERNDNCAFAWHITLTDWHNGVDTGIYTRTLAEAKRLARGYFGYAMEAVAA